MYLLHIDLLKNRIKIESGNKLCYSKGCDSLIKKRENGMSDFYLV